MSLLRPHRSTKTRAMATAWAKANPQEWDFSRVPPHERGMAVAWEYGREKYELFQKYRSYLLARDRERYKKTRKPFETLHGTGISHIFLTFWQSPHWPNKPFLSLSAQQKKMAFPKFYHSDTKTTSDEILAIVKDVTPGNPFKPEAWDGFHKNFDLADYVLWEIENPVKKVFLVDMNQSPGAILKSFKDHLNRAGFKQGRGRSTLEKDLLALTVHRLFKKYNNYDAMDDVLGSKGIKGASILALRHTRKPFWNYAQARLGHGWGIKGGKSKNSKPIFLFSRVEGDYE